MTAATSAHITSLLQQSVAAGNCACKGAMQVRRTWRCTPCQRATKCTFRTFAEQGPARQRQRRQQTLASAPSRISNGLVPGTLSGIVGCVLLAGPAAAVELVPYNAATQGDAIKSAAGALYLGLVAYFFYRVFKNRDKNFRKQVRHLLHLHPAASSDLAQPISALHLRDFKSSLQRCLQSAPSCMRCFLSRAQAQPLHMRRNFAKFCGKHHQRAAA